MKRLIVFFSILVIVFGFQNCDLLDQLHPDDKNKNRTHTEQLTSEGNGSGYTGKLVINGPDTVSEGETFRVEVENGKAPYELSTSTPNVEITRLGPSSFEIRPLQGFNSSTINLEAKDSNNERGQKSIRIINGQSFFNYGIIDVASVSNDKVLVYDKGLKRVLAFDRSGELIKLIGLGGNEDVDIIGVQDIELAPNGSGVFVLTSSGVDIYDNNLEFQIRLTNFNGSSFSDLTSISILGDFAYLVDRGNSLILKLDIQNFQITSTDIQGVSLNSPFDIAIDEELGRIVISDQGSQSLLIFNIDFSFLSKFDKLPNSSNSFVRPGRLLALGGGDFVFYNYIPGDSENADRDYRQELYKLNLDVSEAQHLTTRSSAPWRGRTNCLSKIGDGFAYCKDYSNFLVGVNTKMEVTDSFSPNSLRDDFIYNPSFLRKDEKGHLFIRSHYNYVLEYDPQLNQVHRYGGDVGDEDRIHQVAGLVLIDNLLYISDFFKKRLLIFDIDSKALVKKVDLFNTSGESIHPMRMEYQDKRLYISNNRHVYSIFDLDGRALKDVSINYEELPELGPLRRGGDFVVTPRDIAIDENMNKYVYDIVGRRIVMYDSQDQFVKKINATYVSDGMEISGKSIYFADRNNNRILIFDLENETYVSQFGGPGILAGQFNNPGGVLLDENELIVCDRYNQRVQFIPLSQFQSLEP